MRDQMNNVLTTEQAQQIEEALKLAIRTSYSEHNNIKFEAALTTIRAVRAQGLVTVVKPWAYGGSTGVNDYLMSDGSIRALTLDEVKAINAAPVSITTPDVCGEVCARAKLCYGCNKDLEEANAKYADQAEQEPVVDLSKVKHEDKCCYWDTGEFCDCGADSHELLKWYRNNAASQPVQEHNSVNNLKQAKEIAEAVLDHCYSHSGVNDDMIGRTSVVVKKILDKQPSIAEPVKQEPSACYLGFNDKLGHVFRLEKDIPIGTKLYLAPT